MSVRNASWEIGTHGRLRYLSGLFYYVAGGNLSTVTTILAIENSLKIPDAVVLEYPCLSFVPNPSPSRILFYNDPIISIIIGKKCSASYIPKGIAYDHYLVSPLYTSDEILKKFPEIYMQIAEFDPLAGSLFVLREVILDEGIQFADKMELLGKKVNCRVYEGLPHGFLGFELNKKPFADVAEFLKKIFNQS